MSLASRIEAEISILIMIPGMRDLSRSKLLVSYEPFLYIFDRLNRSQLVTLKVDSKLISVYCHSGDFGCEDGGRAPVMKIDGRKVRL